jgi:hypothetical protein
MPEALSYLVIGIVSLVVLLAIPVALLSVAVP